jgi:hypothetical protein
MISHSLYSICKMNDAFFGWGEWLNKKWMSEIKKKVKQILVLYVV